MKAMITVLREQFNSLYLIGRLSLFEVKNNNNSNYLGMGWEIINPMIQIFIYWFVFGYGIRSLGHGNGRSGIHLAGHAHNIQFFPWMLAGIGVWFFVNQGILLGCKSIFQRIKMVSKMNFPMSVIPTYVIFSKLYSHLFMVIIIYIILLFMGFPLSFYIFQLPYYIFGTLALLFAISLVTSTLAAIARDVQMAIQAFMRMLLYLSPFLWSMSTLPEPISTLVKLNPLYYLAEGYRYSLLGGQWYLAVHLKYTIYFWALIIVLTAIGSAMHLKFRDHFVEYV